MDKKTTAKKPTKPLSGIDCVLFDLDGTLIDTVELIYRSFDYAVQTVLGRKLTKEKLLENMGRPLLVQMQNFSRSQADLLIDAYNRHNLADHDKYIDPYPNADTVLQWLKQKNKKVAVVTSKKRWLSVRGLEKTGLLRYIDQLVAMEDTSHHKPEPDPVLLALLKLDCAAERALFVGDSPYDLIAGRSAGTLTAAALWGPFSPERLREQKPDIELAELGELKSWIGD